MTVLVVDVGNTALKWATVEEPNKPQTFVHQGHDHVPDALQQAWLNLKPTRVVGCMVSSENLALALTKLFNKHQITWEWLHSEREFTGPFKMRNCYDNYQQLGSDRWHAAIGAASLYPNQALLVVHMGTATTIDTVLPSDQGLDFLGGRILPGPTMMFDSLLRRTRCRPGGVGVYKDTPLNTADAISTGIVEAHLGVIDRAARVVQQRGFTPQIVFAGGAAPMLAPYIVEAYPSAVLQHNLVLRGLALRSKEES